MVQMLLCSRPRWSMMKIFEACVLRRRLAVWGNQEEAEKLGRGWKGQANLKEEKGKGKNGGRREGGRRSRENNWGGGGGGRLSSAILCFSQGPLPAVQSHGVTLTCADHRAMRGVQQPWVRMVLTPRLLRRCPCLLPGKGARGHSVSEQAAVWSHIFGRLCWLPYFSFRPRACSCGPVTMKQICLWVTDEQ